MADGKDLEFLSGSCFLSGFVIIADRYHLIFFLPVHFATLMSG